MEEVAKMDYPGADADTVRYFKDVYIPSSIDIFEALGQTPDDIAKVGITVCLQIYECFKYIALKTNSNLPTLLFKSPQTFIYTLKLFILFSSELLQCTKKVIESSRPRFRNLTNSLYTPIVAMKYADETGGLSVHTFYNLLFNFGSLMHITMSILKCLTCSCLRRRTISPDWRGQQWDAHGRLPIPSVYSRMDTTQCNKQKNTIPHKESFTLKHTWIIVIFFFTSSELLSKQTLFKSK